MTGHALALQLGFSEMALGVNLEGISDEEAQVRPAGGGNSINWVLGHIVSYRQTMLEQLGASPVWPQERTEAYGRGSSGEVPAHLRMSVARLLDDLRKTTATLTPLLDALSPEAMAAPSSNPKRTLGQAMAFLVFHESYHAGQVGLLRRLVGKPGAIR